MATRQRRTKRQDWNKSSDSNTDHDDDNVTTRRMEYVSSVEREHRAKIKETRKKLSTFCDSEEDSDAKGKNHDGTRLLMTATSLPIFTKYSKRIPNKKRKCLNSEKESKSDSSSSSEEFRKIHLSTKNPTLKFKNSNNKHLFDDYSDVSTPTKTDDENIVVDNEQDVSFKNYINEEIKKIEKILETLKSDLEIQKEFFVNKKVKVVRDSKFIAHKILSLYDETHHKIKDKRDNFVNVYKTWINTCSKSAKSSDQKKIKTQTIKIGNNEKIDNVPNKNYKEKNNSKKALNSSEKYENSDESDKNDYTSKKGNINCNNETNCNESNMSYKTDEPRNLSESDKNETMSEKSEKLGKNSECNEKQKKNINTLEEGLQHNENVEKSKSSASTKKNSIAIKFQEHDSNKEENKTEDTLDQTEENDSAVQVSDCDSDQIFSEDENRSKKSKEKNNINENNEEKDLDDIDKLPSQNNKSVINSSKDLFDSTSSEIASTPVKSPILGSKNKSFRKTLLKISKTTEKSISNESELNSDKEKEKINSDTEDSELKAFNNLKEECDSDISTICVDRNDILNTDSDNSRKSSCSTVIVKRSQSNCESPKQKSNNVMKKKKRFIMQTKKHSICSDSSSDSAEEFDRRKNSRLVKDDDLARRKRRQQTFNIRKNRHYKADKKLRMVCRVTLERLSQIVLKKYSRALEKSKNNVENKMINSITNLEDLEAKKKSKKKFEALESSLSDSTCTRTKSKKKRKNEKASIEDLDKEHDVLSDSGVLDKSNDNDQSNDFISNIPVEQEIVIEVENKAKEDLLRSCSSSDNEDEVVVPENDECPKKSKSSKSKNVEKDNCLKDMSNEKNGDEEISEEILNRKKEKSSWKNDKVLNFNITDTESEEEKVIKSQEKKKARKGEEENELSLEDEEMITIKSDNKRESSTKKKKSRKPKRVLDSDSDEQSCSSDEKENDSNNQSESEEEKEDAKKKKKSKKRKPSSDSDTSSSEKKPKTKRKRIKKVTTDSDSEDQDSPGKGRKNIRKVLKDKHVADDTKKAALDEEERLKRIAERQKLFNAMYDAKLAGEAKVEKLVLDFDQETKEELVIVDEELVKRLKPHQAQGIKFMWDACFESLEQIKKSEGSGCIIAHCMGLGKSFQVVTLTHTLLSHEKTGVKTVMVVCPLSTVLNWVNEFKTWLKHVKNSDDIDVYELTKSKKNIERKYQLESWHKHGGVLIIGYEMFRNLTSTGRKMRKAMQESIMRSLVDPGADLVVCDEGHLLKNEDSALSKAMKLVKTLRRVVLTGTPLQNNLKEYHCMVQFVKPNLLGTKKEFLNRFVNPITNGQFDDSTPYDVKLMKKRAHVLHKMLEGSVQRFDYSVLTPFLPPKQEYVIFVRLTEVQIKMYQHYIDNFARRFGQRNGSLFADFQELQRIWTHPYVLRLNAEKVDKANEKKRLEASDSEGSLKDFIDDDSESESINSSSSGASNSDIQCIDSDQEKPLRNTRSSRAIKEESEETVPHQETTEESAWWSKFLEENHFLDLRISTKLILLFGILKESEQIGDKVLVFSQSLYSLTLIEQFLSLIDQETQNGVEAEHLDNHSGNWGLGLDYFRLDGSTSAENRSAWCKIFNNPNNTRARLFLISTRAGGLGINLTAANRVIIFDASWNPSHDVQSIFRIYRFGQKKPCYVYRFLAAGTMEEKIYNRQVTKLSLACRVVDEQQIERHYSNNDLAELYQFESYEGKSLTLNLPKDRLLAEIFLKYKDAVYTYHEHDSLLENKQEEELDEEERKQAWLEYEEEKQGKRQIVNTGNNMLFNQMMMNINSFPEFESIKLLVQKDHPNVPPEHLDAVARQVMFDMYRFVDQQSVNQLLNPFAAGQTMQPQNMLGASAMQQMQQQYNQQSQLLNMLNQPQMNYPGANYMQPYSGRGRPPKHLSMNNPMSNVLQMQASMQMPMRTPMQTPIQTPLQTSLQTHLQTPLQTPLKTSMQPQQAQPPIGDNDSIEILNQQQMTPNIDSTSNISDKQNK